MEQRLIQVYKKNYINSSKKNINNDTNIDKPKDRKYNYGYTYNRQYSQNTYNAGEFQPKKFFGKINFSSKDQYNVKNPYDYKPKEKKEEKSEKNEEKNEKSENSAKKMFFNSKIDNSIGGNLKALDSSDDLFLGKYMKYTSAPSLGFNSSNENSLQNLPGVQNVQKEKVEEEMFSDEDEKNEDNINNNKNRNQIWVKCFYKNRSKHYTI